MPKEDPLVKRQWKIKRRMKKFVPPKKEKTTIGWTESRMEKGNLRSRRTSTDRKAQSQTGNPLSPTTMTDEQKKELKKELGNMGLDVDVAMYELGLSEYDPYAWEMPEAPVGPPSDTGGDRKDDGKAGPGGKMARPALLEEPTPPPDDMIPLLIKKLRLMKI